MINTSNTNILLIITLLITISFGCTKIDSPIVDTPSEYVVLKAITESNDVTKTILTGTPNDPMRYVFWEPEDEIIVSRYSENDNSVFKNTLSESSSYALFEGEISKGDSYVAFYPSSMMPEYDKSTNIFSFYLPLFQTYTKNTFGKDCYPMVAKQLSDSNELLFKNLCGVLGVNLVGKDTIKSIVFSAKGAGGDSKVISGKMSVDVSKSTYSYINVISGNDRVILDCGDGVPLDSVYNTTFYIVLPPDLYNSFNVNIMNNKGEVMSKSSEKYIEIKRSIITYMSSLKFEPDVSGYVYLDRYGSANSYIVSQTGKYGFPAVKGNSGEKLQNISKVEVLWESFGTDAAPLEGDLIKEVNLEGENVIFSTQDFLSEGNAVIAAKDSVGDVLWSWHIWFTDEPEQISYSNNAGIMMDRNLGATSSTPGDVGSLGLLYQWGRKDPFLGSSSISESITALSTKIWPSSVNGSSYGTIDYAIKNPMVYINQSNNDWCRYPDSGLWTPDNKTKYDPCPPGWKVPYGGNNGIWTNAGFSTAEVDEVNNGLLFRNIADSDAWYPAAGFLTTNAQLTNVGTTGYYSSNNAMSLYEYGYHYYAYVLNINLGGNIYTDTYCSRGNAISVRCVRE